MSAGKKTLLPDREEDERWMGEALAEARLAAAEGEVPVGCVIVSQQMIIGRGHNRRETENNPLGHAELMALSAAAQVLKSWRVSPATCYVTCEPCPMCAGALVNARVDRLVFGCCDPKAGAAGTLFNIVSDPRLNHRLQVTAGVREEECRELLQSFFQEKRKK